MYAISYIFLNRSEFFQERCYFVPLTRSVVAKGLKEESHRPTALREEVGNALFDL